MGMYNIVYKRCPQCDGSCNIQIPQIELRFGGFDISDPAALAKCMTKEKLIELREAIGDSKFYCACGNVFTVSDDDCQERIELAKKLFGSK